MATLTVSEVHVTQGRAYPLLQPVATPDAPAQTAPDQAAVIVGSYACGPQDAVLAVVRLYDNQAGVQTATYDNHQPVLGIVINKPSSLTAQVVSLGAVSGFSGLVVGARYFLGADGRLVTPPLTDPKMLYVHPVGVAIASDTLFVQPNWPVVKRLP